jgi:hypothetical protein
VSISAIGWSSCLRPHPLASGYWILVEEFQFGVFGENQ